MAARFPECLCTLLDGRTERVRLLVDVVRAIAWNDRVEVVAERAEDAARGPRRGTYDLVVARGFGRPAVTAECGAALLRTGGILVVSDPPDARPTPARWPPERCALLGLEVLDRPPLPWSFTVLRSCSPCPDRYPRRVGVPGKRPLF